MCVQCWEQEYGSASIDSEATRAAAAAIDALYEAHDAGGSLHIVVDDWNLEDEHLAWCRALLEREGYGPGEFRKRGAPHFDAVVALLQGNDVP